MTMGLLGAAMLAMATLVHGLGPKCMTSDECPNGMVCNMEEAVCVASGGDDQTQHALFEDIEDSSKLNTLPNDKTPNNDGNPDLQFPRKNWFQESGDLVMSGPLHTWPGYDNANNGGDTFYPGNDDTTGSGNVLANGGVDEPVYDAATGEVLSSIDRWGYDVEPIVKFDPIKANAGSALDLEAPFERIGAYAVVATAVVSWRLPYRRQDRVDAFRIALSAAMTVPVSNIQVYRALRTESGVSAEIADDDMTLRIGVETKDSGEAALELFNTLWASGEIVGNLDVQNMDVVRYSLSSEPQLMDESDWDDGSPGAQENGSGGLPSSVILGLSVALPLVALLALGGFLVHRRRSREVTPAEAKDSYDGESSSEEGHLGQHNRVSSYDALDGLTDDGDAYLERAAVDDDTPDADYPHVEASTGYNYAPRKPPTL
eukprot:Clim_evm17s154 gene=Clim_evmTU17s154